MMNDEHFHLWLEGICLKELDEASTLEFRRLKKVADGILNAKHETMENDECVDEKNKKKLRRLANDIRKNIFIPSIKQRKKLEAYDIYLYLGHFVKWLNPSVLLSIDFLTDEDRANIAYAYRNYVCSPIKLFVMELIYPYSVYGKNEKMLCKSFKNSEKQALIWNFINEHYTELYNYFNSDLFKNYINMLNLHVTPLFAFIFKAPTDNIVNKIRSFYLEKYM